MFKFEGPIMDDELYEMFGYDYDIEIAKRYIAGVGQSQSLDEIRHELRMMAGRGEGWTERTNDR